MSQFTQLLAIVLAALSVQAIVVPTRRDAPEPRPIKNGFVKRQAQVELAAVSSSSPSQSSVPGHVDLITSNGQTTGHLLADFAQGRFDSSPDTWTSLYLASLNSDNTRTALQVPTANGTLCATFQKKTSSSSTPKPLGLADCIDNGATSTTSQTFAYNKTSGVITPVWGEDPATIGADTNPNDYAERRRDTAPPPPPTSVTLKFIADSVSSSSSSSSAAGASATIFNAQVQSPPTSSISSAQFLPPLSSASSSTVGSVSSSTSDSFSSSSTPLMSNQALSPSASVSPTPAAAGRRRRRL
ncbi:hypothetical protein MIND_00307200 [Mycena indigotica]|uniref:Ricin B lectin domain-containing protein n=1 Tax=Mycena indigotica TaxID=2126181 RepID=A0A8H6SZV7_9AGAR|nr:uncharacterized protein MIND_00307200 [Mycena indigotica]KAF7309365.1 hypothetical protein MIND_00307200 [Mycena indigotica]